MTNKLMRKKIARCWHAMERLDAEIDRIAKLVQRMEDKMLGRGPESSREEVSPSDRSLQRDCMAGRVVPALSLQPSY